MITILLLKHCVEICYTLYCTNIVHIEVDFSFINPSSYQSIHNTEMHFLQRYLFGVSIPKHLARNLAFKLS